MSIGANEPMTPAQQEAAARTSGGNGRPPMPGGPIEEPQRDIRTEALNLWKSQATPDEIYAWKVQLYFGGFYKDPTLAYKLLGSTDITEDDLDALSDAIIYAEDNDRLVKDALEYRATLGRDYGGPLNLETPTPPSEAAVVESGISFEQSLRQWSMSNGIPLSDKFITKNFERVMSGGTTLEEIKQMLREKYVANAYPAFREEILAGYDIEDLASPYVGSMAALLELPEDAIGLDNPLVKQALQGTDSNGKPTYMPLWEFERQVKQDPRWANTTRGRDEIASLSLRVLEDFGLMG